MIFITTTSVVVVTFAITLGLILVLMCKKDLFCFQLKFPYFFTDLLEALSVILVIAICHLWLGVVRVVMARMLNRGAIIMST